MLVTHIGGEQCFGHSGMMTCLHLHIQVLSPQQLVEVFIFMQFSEKNWSNNRLAAPLGLVPCLGNLDLPLTSNQCSSMVAFLHLKLSF